MTLAQCCQLASGKHDSGFSCVFCIAEHRVHWCAVNRWLLKAPAATSDDWVMEFKASRDIAPGEELLSSYGERRCRFRPMLTGCCAGL